MQMQVASHVKLPCTPPLEVANPDRGKKRATGRELYPARSPGLSHAAVPRGDGRVTQPSHACRHQTVPPLPAQQMSALRAVSIDHDFHHLAAAVRRHTDDIYAIGERREVEV